MKTPTTFPHKPESLKAWRGVIYKSTSRGHDYFKLVYRNSDGRKTLGFDSIKATIEGIDDLVRKLGQSDGDSIILSGNEALVYRQAMEAWKQLPNAPALNLLVADCVQAKKLVGDASLRDVAQFYVKRHGLNLSDKTVSQVVAELLEEKRGHLSERHVEDLDSRLSRFAKDFQVRLASINGHHVRDWINGLTGVRGHRKKDTKLRPLSARSKNNYLLAIQNLVTFAKEKGYLPQDWDNLSLKPIKEREHDVEVFTPDEVSNLLNHASEKLLPFVALSAFAGIRSAELERLDWSKVDLAGGNITIDKSIAKTNSRRVIPIPNNLKEWLRPLARKSGRVCPYDNVTNALMKLAAAAGVKWKRNGLRHAYGSFRTAQTNDLPRVSFEMGNSPAMVREHYLKLSTAKEAEKYFAVAPSANAAVIAMPQQAA